MTLDEFSKKIQLILQEYPEYAEIPISVSIGKNLNANGVKIKNVDFSADLYFAVADNKKYKAVTLHLRTV